MIPIPSSLPIQVKQLLSQYLCLQLGNQCVPCPYYENKEKLSLNFNSIYNKLFDQTRRTGKADPEEIEKVTNQLAQKLNFDLNQATVEQIRQFMRQKKIGVDCSGFAYHLLKAFNHSKTSQNFDKFFIRTPSPNPLSIFRPNHLQINAHTFTNPSNSQPVFNLNDIQLGDMIRMFKGKHILVILENTSKKIIYAHSSRKWTLTTGVHLGQINITHPQKGLEEQNWVEKTKDHQSFGRYFNHQQGDGIFRLKSRI